MKYHICHKSLNVLSVIEDKKMHNKYRYFIGYEVVRDGEVKYIHLSGYFDSKQKAQEYLKGMDRF